MKPSKALKYLMYFLSSVLVGNLLLALWFGYSDWRHYLDVVVGIVVAISQILDRGVVDKINKTTLLNKQLTEFYAPLVGKLNEPDSRKRDVNERVIKSWINEVFQQCNVRNTYPIFAESESYHVIDLYFSSLIDEVWGDWKQYLRDLEKIIIDDYIRLKKEYESLTKRKN